MAASLEWVQEQPEQLLFRPVDGRHQLLSRGYDWLAPEAQHASRLWPGHPEGFLAAFANIYTGVADAVAAYRAGAPLDPAAYTFPTVDDGVSGVRFVEAAVESNLRDGAWVNAILT